MPQNTQNVVVDRFVNNKTNWNEKPKNTQRFEFEDCAALQRLVFLHIEEMAYCLTHKVHVCWHLSNILQWCSRIATGWSMKTKFVCLEIDNWRENYQRDSDFFSHLITNASSRKRVDFTAPLPEFQTCFFVPVPTYKRYYCLWSKMRRCIECGNHLYKLKLVVWWCYGAHTPCINISISIDIRSDG